MTRIAPDGPAARSREESGEEEASGAGPGHTKSAGSARSLRRGRGNSRDARKNRRENRRAALGSLIPQLHRAGGAILRGAEPPHRRGKPDRADGVVASLFHSRLATPSSKNRRSILGHRHAGFQPAAEAPVHGRHMLVTHLAEALGGKRRAEAAATIENDFSVLVRDTSL